jgi:uncharacterized caspase-like protein
LVINNKNYATAPLINSGNDVIAIADSLTSMRFRVSLLEESNLSDLTAKVQLLYASVIKNVHAEKLVLIYYAGYEIQVNHQNYIVPLGMQFESYPEFIFELYKIDSLFTEINKSQGLQNIIILDAYRNKPFENITVADNGIMSSGLVPIKALFNNVITSATEPGREAADSKRKNGVYTKHLLRHMTKQISVEAVFKKVKTG